MKLGILSGDRFGERILANLIPSRDLLEICPHRALAGSYLDRISGYFQIPSMQSLPQMIDDPRDYLPQPFPCDVIIGIGMHRDLLLELPRFSEDCGAKLILIPVEDPKDCSIWVKRKLIQECSQLGIEIHFPTPFCSLNPSRSELVREFVQDLRIGYPRYRAEIRGDRISKMEVEISAPCGLDWFLSSNLTGWRISDPMKLEQQIADLVHAFPCTASMQRIQGMEDTIQHRASLIFRQAIKQALGLDRDLSPEELRSGVLSQSCLGCGNCVNLCDINLKLGSSSSYGKPSEQKILRAVSGGIQLKDWMHCTRCNRCYDSCPLKHAAYDILTKRDKLWLKRWERAEMEMLI